MTSGKKDDAAGRERPTDTGDEDGTDLVKRLRDNQPLSDTHKVRDERLGEHRQYGMHDVGPGSSEGEPPATRGSNG